MKALILCGGFGTRLGMLSRSVPKSLIECGGRPVLSYTAEKISGIEVKKVKDLKIIDIASNGPRVVLFTEESVKELEERLEKQF